MNNPNDKLIIESRSNYAFQLKGKNLSFSEIRNTSTAFFTSLPEGVRNELYNNMCHGTLKLDCEPELNAYMYAFGAMHNAKLKDAFSHLSTNFFNEREIDIIDYGCGQAMGCISYADYIRENNHTQNVRRITLIEPSYIALARAALHSSLLFPNAEIVTINKGFDDLTVSDIEVDSNIPTLHIFSNVLDMGSTPNYNGVFNLGTFSNLVLEISKGYNEYVITEPLFSDFHRDEQTDIFTSSLGVNVYYERKCNTGEFVANKTWTCVIKCGCIGLPDEDDIIPDNEIWYVTTDSQKLKFEDDPIKSFGANMVSNTYNNEIGVLKFDKALNVINHFAFAKCHNLRELHLPQNVTKLGDGIFGGCSSLERFVIPNNVTKIPNFAFHGCCNLQSVYLHNNIIEIGTQAFGHCTSLINIKIPESVAIIKNSAFCYCVNISEMEIPQNVTSIGFGILEDCTNIKKFYGKFASDDGLCLIYKGRLLSFANGCGITEYIVPNSVVKIDYKAFAGCDTLTQLTISDEVVEIGEYAFLKCINLSRIKILGDIKNIKPNAFWDCDKITAFSGEIASSDGLCLIVNNELVAFARGCNMAHYTIPNEVIKIAPLVFRNCKYLQTIDIPDGVMTIEYCNFIQCPRLEKFYGKFASDDGLCVICGNKLIAYASNCGHKKYIIPNNVTEICDGAFYNCHNLIEIHIPNTVTKIGSQVWGNCTSLQCITFPENVYLIRNKCFIGCEDLTSIYFKPVVPPTDDLRCIGQPNFFNKETCDVTFYVLQDSISKYKHSWPQYADNIVGYSYED